MDDPNRFSSPCFHLLPAKEVALLLNLGNVRGHHPLVQHHLNLRHMGATVPLLKHLELLNQVRSFWLVVITHI
ncbi:hypothetical protein LINGRAHAP2_LOCUS31814 [Linum grandiflorum]